MHNGKYLRHMAASCTYHRPTPSCSTRAITEKPNSQRKMFENFLEKVRRMGHVQKMTKTERLRRKKKKQQKTRKKTHTKKKKKKKKKNKRKKKEKKKTKKKKKNNEKKRRERTEIGKRTQITALRLQTGEGHQTSPASFRGYTWRLSHRLIQCYSRWLERLTVNTRGTLL